MPEGKGFKAWKVRDKEGKEEIKGEGSFLYAMADLTITPDFYELPKEVKEENKQTFDETKKKDEDYSKIWNITCPADTENPSIIPSENPQNPKAKVADKIKKPSNNEGLVVEASSENKEIQAKPSNDNSLDQNSKENKDKEETRTKSQKRGSEGK